MTQDVMQSAGSEPPWAAGTSERMHELNPCLDDQEIAIVETYGKVRRFAENELLWSAREQAPMMLVLEGSMDIIVASAGGEEVIISHDRGHYSGETTTMAGGRALVGGRAGYEGLTALVVEPSAVQKMIATETDLGEKVLLSFILRRMRIIAENHGSLIVIGNAGDAKTGDLLSLLSRSAAPFTLIDASEKRAEAEALLQKHELDLEALPVLLNNDVPVVRPSNRDVADSLGLGVEVNSGDRFDLAVVGSGPAGLASAVYAASEGLSVVVLERCAMGGQAGSSSRIENYLGFPTGISGQGLMGRGYIQALKFGAKIAIGRDLVSLRCGNPEHKLELDSGEVINAGSVIIATGAIYRQPSIDHLDRYSGVHYGASHIEAQMCHRKKVIVIGGGNSAGQAAVYLSKHAEHVSILIRGESLASSMSDYLIQRIERLPNVELLTHTEVVSVHGEEKLESVTLVNNRTQGQSQLEISDMFIFIGAQPGSAFVDNNIALDDKGFVLTGDAIPDSALASNNWNLDRKPYLLETSCPRVFATGDVRSGSIKRVASAVGEGSICVQFVHRVLAE